MPLWRASNIAASAMSVLPMPVGTDQHPLLRREPGQEGLFLERIGRKGDLLQKAVGDFVAGGGRGGHAGVKAVAQWWCLSPDHSAQAKLPSLRVAFVKDSDSMRASKSRRRILQ